MCGIAGKLYLDGERVVDPSLIRRMTDSIMHRGPDASGMHIDGPIGLGHRRLSIIDLSTGAQPMCNEDASVWIVFNGEIYNFQELRADLIRQGHVFRSTSDTEVIVHLYEEYGDACVTRLRGMFAFALWDDRRKRLLLARDRVGIKPLYYYANGEAVVFASEIKAVLVDPSVGRKINCEAIDRFLTYYYLPGTETLLDGIHKVEPGHYIVISGGKLTTHQYWDLRFESSDTWTDFDEAVEALEELLSRTVKDHMISDVPIGVLSSGGVDSTAVLRHAVSHSSNPVNTFTVGFAGEGFADERHYARLAAKEYKTVHQDITLTATDFQAFLPRYVWHMEEPVCEPPAISLYYISEFARQSSVKVLLSGEGGDEAFGGYPKYRNLMFLDRLKRMLGPASGLLCGGLRTLDLLTGRDTRHYRSFIERDLSEYYYGLAATPDTPFNLKKNSLYAAGFRSTIGASISNGPTQRLFSKLNGQPLLQKLLYVDTKSWLPDDLLVKADKMTMAASVELRVPLLDHQVLEFAASLPCSFKVHRRSTKRILRTALKNRVPAQVLKRRKAGFPLPYNRWLRNELRDFACDTILAKEAALDRYFDKKALRGLLEDFQLKGDRQHALDCSREVFCLLILEIWHQTFGV